MDDRPVATESSGANSIRDALEKKREAIGRRLSERSPSPSGPVESDRVRQADMRRRGGPDGREKGPTPPPAYRSRGTRDAERAEKERQKPSVKKSSAVIKSKANIKRDRARAERQSRRGNPIARGAAR